MNPQQQRIQYRHKLLDSAKESGISVKRENKTQNKTKSLNKVDLAGIIAESRRLEQLMIHEDVARQSGYRQIAGVDEAGRGPLAGPVVAAACLIPADLCVLGIDDSKKLSSQMREEIFECLVADSRILYGIGIIEAQEIDAMNIHQASLKAMLLAIAAMPQLPDYLLIDGFKLPHPTIPAQKIVGGDALSQSIAAASILAKVTRDRVMITYHQQWPQYSFQQHKGYPTSQHIEALKVHGPCPIHRRTFAPVKEVIPVHVHGEGCKETKYCK